MSIHSSHTRRQREIAELSQTIIIITTIIIIIIIKENLVALHFFDIVSFRAPTR
jgi:hypothetical protein